MNRLPRLAVWTLAVCSLGLAGCAHDATTTEGQATVGVDYRGVPEGDPASRGKATKISSKATSQPTEKAAPTSRPMAKNTRPGGAVTTQGLRNVMTEDQLPKTDDEWRKLLTDEQFQVLRKHATERAFTGKYWDHKGSGTYACAGCGLPLFDSKTKFRSGTGWPSFYQPIDGEAVGSKTDRTLGMVRVEVHCNRCKGHLGHVFNDCPKPTGQRYCINSASLQFAEGEGGTDKK